MTDIGNFVTADKVAEIDIKHPATGAKTGVVFQIYGKHSQTFRNKMNANIDARQTERALDNKAGRDTPMITVAEQQAENRELLSCCIAGWYEKNDNAKLLTKKTLSYKGQELEFSPENARLVMNDPDMVWLVDQVDTGVTRIENFTNA